MGRLVTPDDQSPLTLNTRFPQHDQALLSVARTASVRGHPALYVHLTRNNHGPAWFDSMLRPGPEHHTLAERWLTQLRTKANQAPSGDSLGWLVEAALLTICRASAALEDDAGALNPDCFEVVGAALLRECPGLYFIGAEVRPDGVDHWCLVGEASLLQLIADAPPGA